MPRTPAFLSAPAPAPAPPAPGAPRRRARRHRRGWWQRSYDLLAEFPALLDGLPRIWGHIASVLPIGQMWPTTPGRMFVAGQVFRLCRRLTATGRAHRRPRRPGHGRWDLLVAPGFDRGGRGAGHGACGGYGWEPPPRVRGPGWPKYRHSL
ncbi:DUF5994 family protein [Streptomyces sp. NBC_01304]|uniref:DUF5994 family protein n=1 Tax=Streptomyces sp. NBC_01304 TaxID=2903818 RepID=UPI002E13CA72|nr:DUF5994 family protein [Streptomyces sp. NBC_01304]